MRNALVIALGATALGCLNGIASAEWTSDRNATQLYEECKQGGGRYSENGNGKYSCSYKNSRTDCDHLKCQVTTWITANKNKLGAITSSGNSRNPGNVAGGSPPVTSSQGAAGTTTATAPAAVTTSTPATKPASSRSGSGGGSMPGLGSGAVAHRRQL